jgi:hypothetical protein
MNKQIQQLAEQAQLSIPVGTLTVPEWIEAYNQKFAQLIVRECCDIADEVERADMDSYVSKYIRAHFGVEE